MSRLIVNRFFAGNYFSNVSFKSAHGCILQMNSDGSLTWKSNNTQQVFDLQIFDLKMPINKIGMDKNGILRAFSILHIQYPLEINYTCFNFKGKDVYGILQDDMSFGAFRKGDNRLLYEARF